MCDETEAEGGAHRPETVIVAGRCTARKFVVLLSLHTSTTRRIRCATAFVTLRSIAVHTASL